MKANKHTKKKKKYEGIKQTFPSAIVYFNFEIVFISLRARNSISFWPTS